MRKALAILFLFCLCVPVSADLDEDDVRIVYSPQSRVQPTDDDDRDRAGYTPRIVQASVRVGECCSGTVIAEDAQAKYAWIHTAGHCVNSKGQTVTCEFPYHEHDAQGRVVAVDRSTDQALIKVYAKYAPADARVAQYIPSDGVLTACGYTSTVGPKYKNLNPRTARTMITSEGGGRMARSQFGVQAGPFAGGDSGGSVAVNGQLAGIITHGGEGLYAMTYPQMRRFLVENADRMEGCNEWWCQPNVQVEPPEEKDLIAKNNDLKAENRQLRNELADVSDKLREEADRAEALAEERDALKSRFRWFRLAAYAVITVAVVFLIYVKAEE